MFYRYSLVNSGRQKRPLSLGVRVTEILSNIPIRRQRPFRRSPLLTQMDINLDIDIIQVSGKHDYNTQLISIKTPNHIVIAMCFNRP